MAKPPSTAETVRRQSRREFIHRVGEIGGISAAYQAMLTMGLLSPGDAEAAATRKQWQSRAAQSQSGPKPTVAILGGGIAGLCVAYELKKAGFPYFVLEAQSRPGGRNHTLRAGSTISEVAGTQRCDFDVDEELYFNAGPARIPQHHSNLLSYCSELNIPLQAFVNDNRGAYIHSAAAFGGQPVRAREVITSLRGYISELLAKAINSNSLNSEISFAERASVLAVLRDFGALTPSYQQTGTTRSGLVDGTGGLTPPQPGSTITAEQFINDQSVPFVPSFAESYNQSATMMQPVGGMDKIAYALAAQLEENIYYNVEVTAIRRSGTGVRIEGRTPELSGSIEADYAIITIPPPILRTIANDFSSATQSAIGQVRMANPTKIAFQSPRFWEKEEQIYGGISWTDPGIRQVWYPSGGFGQDQGVIVGSYLFGGSNASHFSNLSPEARIEFALAAGEKIHPSYRGNLNKGISVAWSNVNYSRGGWAVSNPSAVLQKPDGPFLFAGDHLTYLQGWQEGAVMSGLNALNNLHSLQSV
ncbi:MAG: flavin monoamine oxidase family protein [Pseudohongiellaceae bacterium]